MSLPLPDLPIDYVPGSPDLPGALNATNSRVNALSAQVPYVYRDLTSLLGDAFSPASAGDVARVLRFGPMVWLQLVLTVRAGYSHSGDTRYVVMDNVPSPWRPSLLGGVVGHVTRSAGAGATQAEFPLRFDNLGSGMGRLFVYTPDGSTMGLAAGQKFRGTITGASTNPIEWGALPGTPA